MSLEETPWRFAVYATERKTGRRCFVGRATDRGGADALAASAKAQEIYRDIVVKDLREGPVT